MAPCATLSSVAAVPCARPALRRVGAVRTAPVSRPAGAIKRASVVTSAVSEDQKMQEAQARWDAQIREGKVRNVSTSEAGQLMKDGWVMLDVRPSEETEKAGIVGSVQVPVFIPDTEVTPGSLIKQMSAFGMGGWWLGGTHMVPYNNFLPDVLSKIPKDANVIVGCQKGLRSLAACEQLSRAGYKNLAWVNGGFDTTTKGDIEVESNVDIRYAGIGGLSAVVGWTEVQQQDEKGLGGGVENVLKLVGLVVVLDALVFAYEQLQYMQGQQ